MNSSDCTTEASPVVAPPALVDSLWFNGVWFQCVWLSAVLGRQQLLPLTVSLLVLHLALVSGRRRELWQMAGVGGLGIAVDAALSLSGTYQFAGGALVPLWLCCLWLAFAAALGRSLSWLAGRTPWIALAGAVVMPLNYWAGQRLGGVDFPYPPALTVAVQAATWAVMLPLLYRLSAALVGTSPPGRVP